METPQPDDNRKPLSTKERQLYLSLHHRLMDLNNDEYSTFDKLFKRLTNQDKGLVIKAGRRRSSKKHPTTRRRRSSKSRKSRSIRRR